ncbi:MAG: hypothetical protein H7222_01440 [Methylotenera sp.]|nr:hypothetical protein [Oligoflexia bacterium]
MAVDGQLLRGEVSENPQGEEKNIEQLLSGFLHALVMELNDFSDLGEKSVQAATQPASRSASPLAFPVAPVALALKGPELTR